MMVATCAVEQYDISSCTLEPVSDQVRTTVLKLLARPAQPSAWELLRAVEQEVGFKARWVLADVLFMLQGDKNLSSMHRAFVGSLLDSGDLNWALDNTEPPHKPFESAMDNLLRDSAVYRSSRAFQEMIDFMARFRKYSPYNNMLVRIQDPACSYFARAKDWQERFRRYIKEDENPMLILAPKSPVLMVYGLDQTDGVDPLPEELDRFAQFEGEDWKVNWLKRAVKNAELHYHIQVVFKRLSSTLAGYATTACPAGWKMRIVIHKENDLPSQFGVLCHELAHVLLGHLGSDQDNWWPSRIMLNTRAMEIEAESVAHLVTTRFGLNGSSARYISRYMNTDRVPVDVSVDTIARVTSRIESMARKRLPDRKSMDSHKARATG